MKVIEAPEYYFKENWETTVFLAGGITDCPDWQQKCINNLSAYAKQKTSGIVLFNPRRANFPINDPMAAKNQISWEYKWIENCDVFSMYFSSGKSVQPICLYELGRNIVRMQNRFPTDWEKRLIITAEAGYQRLNDVLIQTKLATGYDLVTVGDLPEIALAKHVVAIMESASYVRSLNE